jgi:hypothetical protein
MGTLRIKIVITRGELLPAEYHLEGVDPAGHAHVYYNLGDITGDIQYLNQCKLYCVRKINFSQMVVGTTKNFQTNYSKGTITYYKNPSQPIATTNQNTLRCMGLNRVCLINCGENINQASRKKLPQFLLASDLTQFKENVHFDAIWGDNLRAHHRSANTQGKYMIFVLNLFTTP